MTTTDHSDYTEVLNEFHDPGTGNVCLGVWEVRGHNTYKLKHPAFLWDANGVWIGYRILRLTVTLAPDGNSFTEPGAMTARTSTATLWFTSMPTLQARVSMSTTEDSIGNGVGFAT
jgi:hypothetical protein